MRGQPVAAARPEASAPLLAVRDLTVAYGRVRVVHGIDFDVASGEIVVLLGANGAGKTSTLRAVSGMIPSQGRVELAGETIRGRSADRILRRGIAHVPQGRGTFPDLTVAENLVVGAFIRKDRARVDAEMEEWFEFFPRLAERRRQKAGSMSGGEQQMLAIARAMMSDPRLLLLDEPSLGLSRRITEEVFERLAHLNASRGTAVVVVEQNADLALEIGHRAYVLESGELSLSGTAQQVRDDESVQRIYLGY
ncbi:ABC transporter ATP-binding protein [Microbacterium sp. 18062]|uniref:ABC transporter ATP-binding protein n=1 Tax=Microbacterium sp. 18062 TaxID=2681410 RepID=UPI001357A567|nr:ABC transporter ATP-binding protein [Microbacterium sp. 18062]